MCTHVPDVAAIATGTRQLAHSGPCTSFGMHKILIFMWCWARECIPDICFRTFSPPLFRAFLSPGSRTCTPHARHIYNIMCSISRNDCMMIVYTCARFRHVALYIFCVLLWGEMESSVCLSVRLCCECLHVTCLMNAHSCACVCVSAARVDYSGTTTTTMINHHLSCHHKNINACESSPPPRTMKATLNRNTIAPCHRA